MAPIKVQDFLIRELDLDMIQPTTENYMNPGSTGSKIVVIGKAGTGKSTVVASILYAKKHIFPLAQVYSGTEDSNKFYSSFIPDTLIHNKLEEEAVEEGFIKRQKYAMQYLPNPWAVLIMDDCTDKPGMLNSPLFHNIYKNGRHWKMLHILSLQYCLDIRPAIRGNVDGVFILRETNAKFRKALWENYASIIPSYDQFCQILDAVTVDYTALYINNKTSSNSIEDCVFYYKAKAPPADFKFGCDEIWAFHDEKHEP